MSDMNSLLWGDSTAARIINESRQPNYLFKDAVWRDIGVDKELTDFLFKSLDPKGSFQDDLFKLKDAVEQAAVKARGGPIWQAAYGSKVPHDYPSSILEHQYLNLIERLYLTSPGAYRLTPLFGQDMISRDERMQIINQHLAGWGLAPAALGISYWIYRRRRSVR